MRQPRTVLAALFLVLAGAAPAFAQAPPDPKALLARLDLDRDGRVNLLEYATGKLREANGGTGGHFKITPKTDDYMRNLDANKDGLVSPEEYQKGYVAEEFRYIDRNKDKLLDAAEIGAAILEKEKNDREGAKNGFVERYDIDRDGKVTREEWGGSEAVFDRLDANRDGVITDADAR